MPQQYRKEFREVQSDYYWSGPRVFLMTVFGIALLGVVGFGIRYVAMEQFGFFAPKYEAIRRDVMIESRAYSEATTREMYRLKLQFQQAATDDEKATIRAMALHEARAFDRARLPADLRTFIEQLGG